MYVNYAYIGEAHADIVDKTKPLLVTASGHNRMQYSRVIATERPQGRGDCQLIYIVSGKGHFFFGDEERIINRGNIVVFRPGERQMYYYYLADKTETYWVHFTGYDAERILDESGLDKNVFFVGESSDYSYIIGQMIREIHTKRENYEQIISLLFRQLLHIVDRSVKEGRYAGGDTLNEIDRAINYFNENYAKEINIEEYAISSHMSVSWFIKNFKNITKLTPLQYIIFLRLNSAKVLLRTTDYSVKQIANTVGFDNALYFSRLFHKHTGVSPLKFRKIGE